jgi:hypothetical protein
MGAQRQFCRRYGRDAVVRIGIEVGVVAAGMQVHLQRMTIGRRQAIASADLRGRCWTSWRGAWCRVVSSQPAPTWS